MKEARIKVDFNELVEPDLVLLSQDDFKIDSNGNKIELAEGVHVKIYDDDLNENNEEDNLIANGVVELNLNKGWAKHVKWNCRIKEDGIKHESDIR